MSQIDGASEQDPGRRGMDRRTMIKAAAVAGVGAWTAPMIIDSLVQPSSGFDHWSVQLLHHSLHEEWQFRQLRWLGSHDEVGRSTCHAEQRHVGVCTSYTQVFSDTTPVGLTIVLRGAVRRIRDRDHHQPGGLPVPRYSTPSTTCPQRRHSALQRDDAGV